MAGSPVRRARRLAAEQAQLEQAPDHSIDPTTRRDQPIPYTPDLDAEVLLLGDHGFAPVEIAAHFAISEDELKAWEEAHPSLAAALSQARTREKAWWVSKARVALAKDNNRFPAGAWSHVMRVRFPEFDKPDFTVNIDLSKRLVLVDMRTGLLDEQMRGDGKPVIEHETVRLTHGLTGENEPADHPTIPDREMGGVRAKSTAPSLNGGRSPDFITPSPNSPADREED